MTVKIQLLEFHLMEPDMEQTARSGVEKSCLQIMKALKDLEVSLHFYRLVEMLLQKKDGVLRYP